MIDFKSNNNDFSNLMKRSKLDLPFNDFEEIVIHRINRELLRKEVFTVDRKLSFFFFLLSTVIGLMVNSLLYQSQYTFLGISAENTAIVFQAIFVLLFFVQLENYFKFFGKPIH